jgi:PrpF protein
VPGTLALNLGATCRIPGTIPYELARKSQQSKIVIRHPSGKAMVGAEIQNGEVKSVELARTARCLMEGVVNWSDFHAQEIFETPTGKRSTHGIALENTGVIATAAAIQSTILSL